MSSAESKRKKKGKKMFGAFAQWMKINNFLIFLFLFAKCEHRTENRKKLSLAAAAEGTTLSKMKNDSERANEKGQKRERDARGNIICTLHK